MKTAEPKTTASIQRKENNAQGPFFKKEGESAFFSDQQHSLSPSTPFFTPLSTMPQIQKEEGDEAKEDNTKINLFDFDAFELDSDLVRPRTDFIGGGYKPKKLGMDWEGLRRPFYERNVGVLLDDRFNKEIEGLWNETYAQGVINFRLTPNIAALLANLATPVFIDNVLKKDYPLPWEKTDLRFGTTPTMFNLTIAEFDLGNFLKTIDSPLLPYIPKLNYKPRRNPYLEDRSSVLDGTIWRKEIKVGQPNDKYEQEADQMADKVVQRLSKKEPTAASPISHHSSPIIHQKCSDCKEKEHLQKMEGEEEILSKKEISLQRKPIFESGEDEVSTSGTGIQRKCTSCGKEEEDHIQEKSERGSENAASADLQNRLNSSKGSGFALPKETASSMEEAFGSDFSGVRVHTDSSAVQMNKELGAQAFTHGSDIYFNSGKYDTGSTGGQRLLAHELVHTVQQKTKTVEPKIQRQFPKHTEKEKKEMKQKHLKRKEEAYWEDVIIRQGYDGETKKKIIESERRESIAGRNQRERDLDRMNGLRKFQLEMSGNKKIEKTLNYLDYENLGSQPLEAIVTAFMRLSTSEQESILNSFTVYKLLYSSSFPTSLTFEGEEFFSERLKYISEIIDGLLSFESNFLLKNKTKELVDLLNGRGWPIGEGASSINNYVGVIQKALEKRGLGQKISANEISQEYFGPTTKKAVVELQQKINKVLDTRIKKSYKESHVDYLIDENLKIDEDGVVGRETLFWLDQILYEQKKSSFLQSQESIQKIDLSKNKEGNEHIQKKSDNGRINVVSTDLQTRLNSTKGAGAPLSKETAASIGTAMGADFSEVRVHTDGNAEKMNQELGAQAFTHGSDIYFNKGKYDTNSMGGKHLLAHELTHTVQQGRGGMIKPKIQLKKIDQESSIRTIQSYFKNNISKSMIVTGKWDSIVPSKDEEDFTNWDILKREGEQLDFDATSDEGILKFLFNDITKNLKSVEDLSKAKDQFKNFGVDNTTGAWKEFNEAITQAGKALDFNLEMGEIHRAIELDEDLKSSASKGKKSFKTITSMLLNQNKKRIINGVEMILDVTTLTKGDYDKQDSFTEGESLEERTMTAIETFKKGYRGINKKNSEELSKLELELENKINSAVNFDYAKYENDKKKKIEDWKSSIKNHESNIKIYDENLEEYETKNKEIKKYNEEIKKYNKKFKKDEAFEIEVNLDLIKHFYAKKADHAEDQIEILEKKISKEETKVPITDIFNLVWKIRNSLVVILEYIKEASEKYIKQFTIDVGNKDAPNLRLKTFDEFTKQERPIEFQKLVSLALDYEGFELGHNNVFTIHYDKRLFELESSKTDADIKGDILKTVSEATTKDRIFIIRKGASKTGTILGVVLFEVGGIKIAKLNNAAFGNYQLMGDAIQQIFNLPNLKDSHTVPIESFFEMKDVKWPVKKNRIIKNEDTRKAMQAANNLNKSIWSNPLSVRIIQDVLKIPISGTFASDFTTEESIAQLQEKENMGYPKLRNKKGEKGLDIDSRWGVINEPELEHLYNLLVNESSLNAAIILILDYYNLFDQLATLKLNDEFVANPSIKHSQPHNSEIYHRLMTIYYKEDAAEDYSDEAAATSHDYEAPGLVILGKGTMYSDGKPSFKQAVRTISHELGHVKQNEANVESQLPHPVKEMYAELMELNNQFGDINIPKAANPKIYLDSYLRTVWEYISLPLGGGALNTDYRKLMASIDSMVQQSKDIPKIADNPTRETKIKGIDNLTTSELTPEKNKKRDSLTNDYRHAFIGDEVKEMVKNALFFWDLMRKWVISKEDHELTGNFEKYQLHTNNFMYSKGIEEIFDAICSFTSSNWVFQGDSTFLSTIWKLSSIEENFNTRYFEKLKGKMINPLDWVVKKFEREIEALSKTEEYIEETKIDIEIKELEETVSNIPVLEEDLKESRDKYKYYFGFSIEEKREKEIIETGDEILHNKHVELKKSIKEKEEKLYYANDPLRSTEIKNKQTEKEKLTTHENLETMKKNLKDFKDYVGYDKFQQASKKV